MGTPTGSFACPPPKSRKRASPQRSYRHAGSRLVTGPSRRYLHRAWAVKKSLKQSWLLLLIAVHRSNRATTCLRLAEY
jgi:hypothetical protein